MRLKVLMGLSIEGVLMVVVPTVYGSLLQVIIKKERSSTQPYERNKDLVSSVDASVVLWGFDSTASSTFTLCI
jgi:hypothetical protein